MSSRLQCRKRRASWKLAVLFLVLGQSVWTTLQCSTSRNPPAINAQRKEAIDSSWQVNSNEVSEEIFRTDSEEVIGLGKPSSQSSTNPYFFRRTRKSGGGAEPFQHCSIRLKFELENVCGGKFHDPNIPRLRGFSQTKRSLFTKRSGDVSIPRRVSRSLVDECCRKSCSKQYVMKYCDHRNGSRPDSTRTTIQSVNSGSGSEPVSNTEISPSASHSQLVPEPEPALYYPLFHIIKFFHRQFSDQKLNFSPDEQRNVLLPQARVQDNPSEMPLHYSPTTNPRRYEINDLDKDSGTPDEVRDPAFVTNVVETEPGRSFFNSAFASRESAESKGAAENERFIVAPLNNPMNTPPHNFQESSGHHRHSTEMAGRTNRPHQRVHIPAPGAVTSTLPPILIPLGPQTNDDDYMVGFSQFRT